MPGRSSGAVAANPRSVKVVGRLLSSEGLDHLVSLDLHALALESALPMRATLLRAEEVFLQRVKSWGIRDLIVVAPEAGGYRQSPASTGHVLSGERPSY